MQIHRDDVLRENYCLINEFLEDRYKGRVAPISMGRYKSYLQHLLLWSCGIPLHEPLKAKIDLPQYLNNKELGWESKKKVLGLTSQFYEWAMNKHPRKFSQRRSLELWLKSLYLGSKEDQFSEREIVTLEEVAQIAALQIPREELPLWRDQVAAIMLFLSGMRTGAFVSMPLKAVNLQEYEIRQYPSLGVRTKNSKSQKTYLLPLPGLIQHVLEWDTFLRQRLDPNSMWYNPIIGNWGEYSLSSAPAGSARTNALNDSLRRIFKLAGLPYRSAHKFRHGHANYALSNVKTMADYKAVSENLMHKNIVVTDSIYAGFTDKQRKERIASLTPDSEGD